MAYNESDLNTSRMIVSAPRNSQSLINRYDIRCPSHLIGDLKAIALKGTLRGGGAGVGTYFALSSLPLSSRTGAGRPGQ